MRPQKTPLAAAVIVAAGLAFWISFRIFTGIQLEDALITYRYAVNLASGAGFVFNPGERVLGTTTPLLTLILAAFGAVLGPERIPLISAILAIAAAAGAAALTFAAMRRMGFPPGLQLFATAAFCFHPEMAWMCTSGMETPLVLLFMALSLHAAASRRWNAAAAASALLVLTRIDGLLWAGAILVAALIQNRRAAARASILATGILAPWVIFAMAYFGSPIPYSVIAKRAIGPAVDLPGLLHLEAFASWAAPFAGAASPFGWLPGLLFLAAAGLAKRGGVLKWLLIVFPFAFCAALFAGRAPLYFDWYLAPVAYAAILAGSIGLWTLAGWLSRGMETFRIPRGAGRAAAAVVILAFFAAWGRADLAMAARQRDYQINEDGTRRAIGLWLAANTPPDATVAMEAVGYQGYFSKRKIVDLAGLTSPEVVRLRRASWSNAECFHRVLLNLAPDYLILRTLEVERNRHFHGGPLFETAQHAAYFRTRYREVKTFVAPLPEVWPGTASLTIYERMETESGSDSGR